MRSSFLFPALSLATEPFFDHYHSEIQETDIGYFIQLDTPGVRREDIKISLEGRILKVDGERSGGRGSIRKAYSLPDDVDVAKIDAQTRDGVLELSLPKKEKEKINFISVREGKESFLEHKKENS